MKTKMTAEEATTFERMSPMHAAILEAAAEERGCTCRPYADWLTYRRWQAVGMQVRPVKETGHGVQLVTWVARKDRDGNETGKSFPRTVTVFCRCQTKPIEERSGAAVPQLVPA